MGYLLDEFVILKSHLPVVCADSKLEKFFIPCGLQFSGSHDKSKEIDQKTHCL